MIPFLKSITTFILPKSLLYRFILIILIPLVLLQTIILIFFYDRHWNTISRRLASDIIGEIEIATYVINTNPNTDTITPFLNKMHTELSLEMRYIPNQHITAQKSEKSLGIHHLITGLNYKNHPYTTKSLDANKQLILIQLDDGVLEVIVPKKRFFSSTVLVFVAWMLCSFLFLFLIAFLFMKNQVRSIAQLSKAAELFGTGHDIHFKPSGAKEVKQAGQSFIDMKNRIYRYFTERTKMLAGVSHDLRTPLTRMKLQLSMMPNDESTTDLLADITEMQQMLDGYLTFAKGVNKTERKTIDFNALLTDIIDKQKRIGQVIDFHAENALSINGNKAELTRAITNILSNANRYAKKTNITLATTKNNNLLLIIDDNGPGIPKNKRTHAFKPFARIDESRNTQTGGVGLGLSITKDIILSHGGHIKLETSPLKGLRVIIKMPKVD